MKLRQSVINHASNHRKTTAQTRATLGNHANHANPRVYTYDAHAPQNQKRAPRARMCIRRGYRGLSGLKGYKGFQAWFCGGFLAFRRSFSPIPGPNSPPEHN